MYQQPIDPQEELVKGTATSTRCAGDLSPTIQRIISTSAASICLIHSEVHAGPVVFFAYFCGPEKRCLGRQVKILVLGDSRLCISYLDSRDLSIRRFSDENMPTDKLCTPPTIVSIILRMILITVQAGTHQPPRKPWYHGHPDRVGFDPVISNNGCVGSFELLQFH